MATDETRKSPRPERLRSASWWPLPVFALLLGLGLYGVSSWLGPGTGSLSDRWSSASSEDGTAQGLLGPCRVERVVDGDTLDVACPGLESRVRLLRVDTPEREQPGYAASTAALRGLVAAGEVHLDFEREDEPLRDRYGRVLAYVFADGRSVNLEMVRMGWTRFDSGFGGGRYANDFESAETEARRARRGLWGMRP